MTRKRASSRTRARAPAAPPPAGVVGLGLMGSTIAACLLNAGHEVRGIERDARQAKQAQQRVREALQGLEREGLAKFSTRKALSRLDISGDITRLAGCGIVIEAVVEDVRAKRRVLREIEGAVDRDSIIGSNTSSLPITGLQRGAKHPARVLGMHWGEPAHILRFMEIICGEQTSPATAEGALHFARAWGKEPTLVRRDVRGFITNRCFYALLREACYLVDRGIATPVDVDRSLRNDLGYWITLAGPFRFLDLTGIPAYLTVARGLYQSFVPPRNRVAF